MKRAVGVGLAVILAGVIAIVVRSALDVATCDVASLATRQPLRTSMMNERIAEAARDGRRLVPDERWVPYDRISPLLRRAVLVAEDDAFYAHGGLDWNQIRASARRQHDHAAAREEPVPRKRTQHHAQAEGSDAGAASRARAVEAAHLRAVPERDRMGRRRVRRRSRGAALVRRVRRRSGRAPERA